jgi:hypothetical protein
MGEFDGMLLCDRFELELKVWIPAEFEFGRSREELETGILWWEELEWTLLKDECEFDVE